MNELGVSLVWLAGQVTLLCLASAAIYLVARRRHPAAGATAALTGLLFSVILTLGLFSPWPRWSLQGESSAANDSLPSASERPSEFGESAVTDRLRDETAPSGEVTPHSDIELESASTAAWTAFWRSLGRELAQPTRQPVESGYRWTGWLAVSLLLAMGLGAVRLFAGWLAVRRCLRRSVLIEDRSLAETLDVLRAEVGCRRQVQLRESSEVASAATIGWRKPVILLPRGWRDWSNSERRVVLAHELAHVAAGDAATWLAAQLGLLLHFYHPLVHWLTHRLRLEQELAADAIAARVTGNSQSYLTTLAELAVRQPDRPLAWPARAFLPTRGTLLRRIEMLRDTKSPPLRSSNLRRATVIVLTLAAGVFVAGLRPPESGQAVAQQQQAIDTQPENVSPSEGAGGFNLENFPASTIALLGVRPAQLVERPEIRPLAAVIEESLKSETTGIYARHIDQFLVGIVSGRDPQSPEARESGPENAPGQIAPSQVLEIRMTQPTDFGEYIETLRTNQIIYDEAIEQTVVEGPLGRRQVLVNEGQKKGQDVNPNAQVAFQADDRTLLLGQPKVLANVLNAKRDKQKAPDWNDRFKFVASDQVCFVWDVAAVRPMILQEFERRPNPLQGMFVPLWQNTELVIGGARMDDRLAVTVNGWSADAASAAKLNQTLTALVPLGRGMLESTKASLRQTPEEIQAIRGPSIEQSVGLAMTALDNLKVQQSENRVTVTVESEADSVATLAAAMLSGTKEAREAARRTQSKNNLKQIGIALHNYHDVNGHFPAPVVYGRSADGKSMHPHSWRVAILPYLHQQGLYDQYDFNEPWDSEHNKKVLNQMPDVFGNPNDKSGPTNAAYFCLVGEHTALGSKPESDETPGGTGVRLPDITDGTSNTLMIVEAKRDVPWTRPEDIPYSPDEDLPELGGLWTAEGFHACLADGRVTFISETIDEATLRNLITRDDGNPIVPF